jgi:hypothetical protein
LIPELNYGSCSGIGQKDRLEDASNMLTYPLSYILEIKSGGGWEKKPKVYVVRRRLDEQLKILNSKTHEGGESRFSPARVRRRLDEQ